LAPAAIELEDVIKKKKTFSGVWRKLKSEIFL
jgi:hypothetical protein